MDGQLFMIFSLNGCVEQWMDRDALTQIIKGKSMIRLNYGSSQVYENGNF